MLDDSHWAVEVSEIPNLLNILVKSPMLVFNGVKPERYTVPLTVDLLSSGGWLSQVISVNL